MTQKTTQFYKRILLLDGIFFLIAIVIYLLFSPIHAYALLTAIVATTLNTFTGFYYIQKYINASTADFNTYIYGSTFVRLLGMMVVIALVLLLSNFPQITFILGLFISYIYKSVLEIIFIHKNSTQRHEKS
jgi:hypothetical protein